jgi:hypothetical protein
MTEFVRRHSFRVVSCRSACFVSGAGFCIFSAPSFTHDPVNGGVELTSLPGRNRSRPFKIAQYSVLLPRMMMVRGYWHGKETGISPVYALLGVDLGSDGSDPGRAPGGSDQNRFVTTWIRYKESEPG